MPLAKYRVLVAFAILFFFSLQSLGQTSSSAELKLMKLLTVESQYVPKDLLTAKTVVIISLSNGDESMRGDWKALAEESHFYIKKLGIDAVLYFYIDDAIAGYDVQRAITLQLVNRDIKNVLLLSKDKIDDRDQYIGIITAFNKEPTYISNNQVAWKSQTSDLEILFRNMARSIDQADLKSENLLIIDSPEYYRASDIIRGKRFELFNTDLRIDKLAVPKFLDLPVPEMQNGASSTGMLKIIDQENTKNLERNSQLEQLFMKYPYQYEIVAYENDEKKLLAKGFQFVLMRVKSSETNVRSLLRYETNVTTTDLGQDYTKSVNGDKMVNKYYVKHINSGDIYLGEQWDANYNWQDALDNHMSAIVEKLSKK